MNKVMLFLKVTTRISRRFVYAAWGAVLIYLTSITGCIISRRKIAHKVLLNFPSLAAPDLQEKHRLTIRNGRKEELCD